MDVMEVRRRERLLQQCQHKAVKANLAKVATVEMGGRGLLQPSQQ